MGLQDYRRKRRFDRTPEPSGTTSRRKGHAFVVQKHDASHLHYDFRLELDGVLKSWAVPKGPSLDPTVKRLAVEVEDHPVDYGSFEGVIPEGQYGGGTVMLWDQGTWEATGDPGADLRKGKLKFHLDGEKLKGGWTLVRTNGARSKTTKPQWLLIKERDAAARTSKAADILEARPLSVASGRDLDEIAAGQSASRRADRKTKESKSRKSSGVAKGRSKSVPKARASQTADSVVERERLRLVDGATKRSLPKRLDVQLATLTEQPPEGNEWIHEIKFDGYRMLCRIEKKSIHFLTRNHQNWTRKLPELVDSAKALSVTSAVLDGEVVSLKPDGTSDFQDLQNAFRDGSTASLRYYVFDLLFLDGFDLRGASLQNRRRVLNDLISEAGSKQILFSDAIMGDGATVLKNACAMGLEGIVSKRLDRPSVAGRGYDWLKTKCSRSEEFVIGGYTDPAGTRSGFGALLVGTHNSTGELIYAGKVGTGFDAKTLRSLHQQMRELEQPESPFADRTRRTGPLRYAHWIKPQLVAQLTYGNRTRDGLLRHASFQGLREDKPAEEVLPDKAVPVKKTVAMVSNTSRTPKSRRKGKAASRVGASIDGHDAGAEEFAGVRLTSPEKVLDPETGITKLEYAEYLRDLAEWMLPHVQNRPLALVRCPGGRGETCFYQKHPGPGTPDELRQVSIREKNETEPYVVVDDVAGLISLAQVGALEIHAWGSHADALETPDRIVIDLDPDPAVPWNRVIAAAREVRQFLKELGLKSFVKTTGGKGLHVVVPVKPEYDWDTVKGFCRQFAESIVAASPENYTANMSKAARKNRIFIDYLRNGRGSTAVVPYSTRAHPQLTVATPLSWNELTPRITSDHFHLRNVRRRLASLKSDPWKEFLKVSQSLKKPMKILNQITSG
jgi:bifunctional non-homologous end joining protein LigD